MRQRALYAKSRPSRSRSGQIRGIVF